MAQSVAGNEHACAIWRGSKAVRRIEKVDFVVRTEARSPAPTPNRDPVDREASIGDAEKTPAIEDRTVDFHRTGAIVAMSSSRTQIKGG
jgi:hypothetical protein